MNTKFSIGDTPYYVDYDHAEGVGFQIKKPIRLKEPIYEIKVFLNGFNEIVESYNGMHPSTKLYATEEEALEAAREANRHIHESDMKGWERLKAENLL